MENHDFKYIMIHTMTDVHKITGTFIQDIYWKMTEEFTTRIPWDMRFDISSILYIRYMKMKDLQ